MFLKRKATKIVMLSVLMSIMALTFTACSNNSKADGKNDVALPNSSNGIVESENKEYVGLEIITAHGVVYYPEYMEEYLHTEVAEQDSSIVTFYASVGEHKDVKIFDIILDSTKHTIEMCELDTDNTWTQEEMDILFSMQEAMNEIAVEVSDVMQTVNIDTPYGTLVYPAKWERYAVVTTSEETDYTVTVSANVENNTVELFSVIFGDETDNALGEIKNSDGESVYVNIIMYDLNLEGLSAEICDIIYGLQEEANDITSNLNMK